MLDIPLIVAFVAGLVSFLSPCVLPIIPGFLAYLAGASLDQTSGRSRLNIFIHTVLFVLGFSLVFAALGVLLNTALEAIAYDVQLWASRIGGAIIIFFGLYLTGLLSIPFLEREHRIAVKGRFEFLPGESGRYLTSTLFGAAFAAGWTPCVGAALGAILGLAASAPGTAFTLLMAYALGLGLPFLLVGLFAANAQSLILRIGPALRVITVLFGVLLIALGVLIFTQSLNLIANIEPLNAVLLR